MTPKPVASQTASASSPPGAGFTSASAQTATRWPRRSPSTCRLQERGELLALDGHVVARELVLDPRRAHVAETALDQLGLELLAEDAAPGNELVGVAGIGPAAPRGVRGGDEHAHRRTALEPEHDDLAAALDVRGDRSRHDDGLPPAVAPERERVGLLLDEPEAVQAEEPVLGARHLLDPPAALAQHLDERRVDAGTARAAVGLGVLVEQAVGDECDAGGTGFGHSRSMQGSRRMGRYDASGGG